MDTNSYFLFGIAILDILMGIDKGTGQQGLRLKQLESKVDALLKKFEIDFEADAFPGVRELAMDGKKIEAIKKYREITGAGLKDAKDYVEQL